MNVSKSRLLRLGWASVLIGFFVLNVGLPAKAGSITFVNEQFSYKPQGFDVIVYMNASGVYTLAKGEQFVSLTVSWQVNSIGKNYNVVTSIATDTYSLYQMPAPGAWDVTSVVSNPYFQEWVSQYQVTLNYKDATGKLRSTSTPWLWAF